MERTGPLREAGKELGGEGAMEGAAVKRNGQAKRFQEDGQ